MEVIAEVPNDGRALQLARELSPDVVIMQVQMPFSRAKETLQAMRAFPEAPKVVVVTMFESPRYVRGLTGVGASATLRTSTRRWVSLRGARPQGRRSSGSGSP
jgi:DNA-binding NarL/FixJ family response regulator